jgi:hypothetical protein
MKSLRPSPSTLASVSLTIGPGLDVWYISESKAMACQQAIWPIRNDWEYRYISNSLRFKKLFHRDRKSGFDREYWGMTCN